MPTRIIIAAIFCLLMSFGAFGQAVTITSKTQTYTRTKPIIPEKRTFTVRRPVVKAATPSLSRKINAAIDPVAVLGIDIKDELNESQWLYEADFKEVFNDKGILTLMVWMEGSGAYPSGVTKYVVVDIRRGELMKPSDVFADIPGLVAAAKGKLKQRIEDGIKEIKSDPDWDDEDDPRHLFEDNDFTADDLANFSVDMAGLAFHYEFGFPHVIKAIEPDGEFRFSWDEIKPFIKPGSLLAKPVR
ncbi:MAG: hypothetical protein AB7Q37_13600 [Pyrinomonadaceae bacterium]